MQEMHQPLAGRTATQHRKTAVSFRDVCLLDIFAASLAALRRLKDGNDTHIQKQVRLPFCPARPFHTVLPSVHHADVVRPLQTVRGRMQALQLAVTCLSFDFVGTAVEDSAEDIATLQIPSTWRSLLEDLSTLQLFMTYYGQSSPPLSNAALECLVRCTSVRRSLFSTEEVRAAYLSTIVRMTLTILQTKQGLQHQENYHEFCRLLGRVRNNYQLSEIMAVDCYATWLDAVAAFTVSSLQGWQWSSSSVHYLLLLWTRLVASAAYLKTGAPNRLEAVMPPIIAAYVESRVRSVQLVAQVPPSPLLPSVLCSLGACCCALVERILHSHQGPTVQDSSLEDPLDNEEALQEQLESLPYLCRFQYERMTAYLCSVLDPLLHDYRTLSDPVAAAAPGASLKLQVCFPLPLWSLVQRGAPATGDMFHELVHLRVVPPARSRGDVQVLEGQIAWFVYMIGAIIKGRLTTGSTDAQELLDGELAARALSVLSVADSPFNQQRYGEESRQRLDIAVLTFFQHFRKVYVGEVVMHSSKVYQRLKESIGIDTYIALLDVILRKVTRNLKVPRLPPWFSAVQRRARVCRIPCSHQGACVWTWCTLQSFGGSDRVITMTLMLFKDLTAGYMSGKLLSKLNAASFILTERTPGSYAFLSAGGKARNRTMFHATLARMIFVEDSPAKFDSFVAPLQQTLEQLKAASGGAVDAGALRASNTADVVAGLFRDLLGIAQATMARRDYMLFFDWLYPAHFPTISVCLKAWADQPDVTTPLLKFMVEFVSNKGQCMVFDSSSPNGILLFREISQLLTIFSSAVLVRPPSWHSLVRYIPWW